MVNDVSAKKIKYDCLGERYVNSMRNTMAKVISAGIIFLTVRAITR